MFNSVRQLSLFLIATVRECRVGVRDVRLQLSVTAKWETSMCCRRVKMRRRQRRTGDVDCLAAETTVDKHRR